VPARAPFDTLDNKKAKPTNIFLAVIPTIFILPGLEFKKAMATKQSYDVLFEPVAIGPVTARNRFYQVPHCSGLGHARPQAEAAMRKAKAEGGWAVVSNQETEIHPTSDLSPYLEGRLWDEHDIPALQLMTDAVHQHGSLAAVELVHNGYHAQNLLTRAPVFAPSDSAVTYAHPKQARAMTKRDIQTFRQWHRDAALRAKKAGFDIIYVYAGHGMSLAQHFMLPHLNHRTDEYGGSLENRIRLTRELLEETKEAVGDSCAVAFRFAVDEMMGSNGMQASEEGRAIVESLSELPDLWDVNVSGWENDSITTRFQHKDGFQNDYIKFVKDITSKPVVAVGRINSPDLMVSMVKTGLVDFIGAARPSIADPFLPNKISEGRIADIRECIGCNICVSADSLLVPIRCTQNPTMGEEWRRGWHPENILKNKSNEEVLVVGAGPAGLECSLALSQRGYEVTLAEAKNEIGGRVHLESALPGLAAWGRVADYRRYHLNQAANVKTFLQSRLTASDVLETQIPNVIVATGAHWRSDGIGRSTHRSPPGIDNSAVVLTPDKLMGGERPPKGSVVIYDDDQAYLAGVLAELLSIEGYTVTFITPASIVSPYTTLTLEQERVQSRLLALGVFIRCNETLKHAASGTVITGCVYSDREYEIEAQSIVLVTERIRHTDLYDSLSASNTLKHLELIGDASVPGLIADAVWHGHLAARNFERSKEDIEREWFRREITAL